MNTRWFTCVFINVALTWIRYIKPPKLDYCFITSTSLVPVAVSTWIQHHQSTEKQDRSSQQHRQPQPFWNMPTLLTTHVNCTIAHVQTLKLTWQRSFKRRNLALNARMNEGSNIQTFLPALIVLYTCIKEYTFLYKNN